jgi:hypothetical protein
MEFVAGNAIVRLDMHFFSFFLIIHLSSFIFFAALLFLLLLLLAFLLAEVKERPSAFAFVKFTKC